MPVKTNTTGKKKKKVVHADAARDIRKALPSWKQAFPALGPSPLAPGYRGPGWAIRFSSPEVQQSITAHLISFPADTACFLPLIKKINKGIGHIRFTSIIAHVVLITVIKSYLPQISGWKCHDPQLKTHCKFYIFQLHSFSSFTKKKWQSNILMPNRFGGFLNSNLSEKNALCYFLKYSERGAFSFCIQNEWLLIFIIPMLAFSFCSAISALENFDMKGIFNDKLKIY